MTTLYCYQPVVTTGPTGTVIRHTSDEDNQISRVAELDGYTYIAVPDGVALPEQPSEITVEEVTLDDALRESIKAASRPCQLIAQRMQEQIRARYSLDDELYLARIGIGSQRGTYTLSAEEDALLDDYQAYVEGVRDWGRAERAKLGL